MKIRIYQIDSNKDTNDLLFMGLDFVQKRSNGAAPDASIYENVYEGEVSCKTTEGVYSMFNSYSERPAEFRGHSLSVSDVVEVVEGGEEAPGCYFCDSFGFKKVEFDVSLASTRDDLLKVVLLEAGKVARVAEIGPSLREMQCVVQGYLEPITLRKDNAVIICNENGKLEGLPLNRELYGADGKTVLDTLVGNCFICGVKDDEFVSLTEEQQNHYKEIFSPGRKVSFARDGSLKAVSSLEERISKAEVLKTAEVRTSASRPVQTKE